MIESIQRPVNAQPYAPLPPIIEPEQNEKTVDLQDSEADEKPLPPIIRHATEEENSIIMYCENCNQKLEVPSELIGKEIECPECHHKEIVPAEDEPLPPAADSPKT